MRKRAVLSLIVTLLLIVSPLFAYQQDDVIRIDSQVVSLEVSVTDKDGKAVTDLKKGDFVIYDNGKRQEITHLTTTDAPFDLVLIIDTSFSTESEKELMRSAAAKFVEQMGRNDRVALIHFSRDVELLCDFTSDQGKFQKALTRVGNTRIRAGSSVYDAMVLSVGKELLAASSRRKAVLMITDGVDSTSLSRYEGIKKQLEMVGAGFYFIDVDTEKYTEAGVVREREDPQRFIMTNQQLYKYYLAFKDSRDLLPTKYASHWLLTAEERKVVNHGLYELAKKELTEIAQRTGGDLFFTQNIQEVDKAYRKVLDKLHTLYSIGFYPKSGEPDGQWHQLRVEIKRPDLKAEHRQGYWFEK